MFRPEALLELLENSGVAFKQNAASYLLTCPICHKSQKLAIRKRDGIFRCWVCAEEHRFRGKAQYALAKLLGGSPRDYEPALYGSVDTIGHIDELELYDLWSDDEFEEPEPEIVGWEWPPTAVPITKASAARGLAYLEGRGIPAAVCERYGIRYSVSENRVLFPFYVGSELVGWQGRICGPSEGIDATGRTWRIPKALTTMQPEIVGRNLMFGNNLDGVEHCVLAEGPISAIKADLCGGNVASLGKAVTRKQIEYIMSRVKKIYLALDPDAAGDVTRLAAQLSEFDAKVYLLQPADGRGDIGDCTFEEVLAEFRQAPRLRPGNIVTYLNGRFCF